MSIDIPLTVCYIIVTETKQTAQPGGKVGIKMKRYGKKSLKEAMENGAVLSVYDCPARGPILRVKKDGENLGWINFDLFLELRLASVTIHVFRVLVNR